MSDAPGLADGPWHWNLPMGVTATSQQVYAMHMMVTRVCALVGIAVFAVMLWAIMRPGSWGS
jgi:cytochrome c oxidase subunit II